MARTDGLTPYKPGQSGNPKGRPKGRFSVGARIRAILADHEGLPGAVKETLRNVVGEDKSAIDAMIMVGLLQALQGDQQWAKLLIEHGWGKPEQTSKIGNLPGETLDVGPPVKPTQAQVDAAVAKLNGAV